ncbi:hypothetical protein OIU34_02385 [Pararhizobium sp. BT-229]|uniref:hypothetical protein n=1 Tax=Pararhizobium sp. BT-229 TaxID=2986923 RepID=UPI0021F6C027|nr:hypothetical protein [Pararhizobium sp. BT-229]MCV9960735.1 hypothetical protein [Pararhizobium sp. BT-229]
MSVEMGDLPSDIIARLDASLVARGQDVTLRRYTAPSGTPRPKTDAGVRAFVRPLKAEELVGRLDHTFSKVIFSPTDSSVLLPMKKDDKVIIDDRERNVEFPKHVRYRGVLVKIELLVAG